jgi:RecA/RadA recombinase
MLYRCSVLKRRGGLFLEKQVKQLGSVVAVDDFLDELKHKRLLRPAVELENKVNLISSGIVRLDRVCGGGLPGGCITEIVASRGGGAFVLYDLLAAATSQAKLAVLIDPADGFDLVSASTAGVVLENVLWLRARDYKQALQSAELILDTGGFGLVVLDLVLDPQPKLRPQAAWMRLKKLVGGTNTLLVVLSKYAQVGSAASLVVQVDKGCVNWAGKKERWLEGVDLTFSLVRKRYVQD